MDVEVVYEDERLTPGTPRWPCGVTTGMCRVVDR